MNIKLFLPVVICCLSVLSFHASAQPPHHPPHPGQHKEISPEAIAKAKVEKMDRDLQLSEKQYKKLYKLFLREERSRIQNAQSMFPPMGEDGMMPPMGGNMPPMEGWGPPPGADMNGGRPPQMGPGQHPDMPPMEMPNDLKSEERIAKKLKKILTEQQYYKWESLQAQELMHEMMMD